MSYQLINRNKPRDDHPDLQLLVAFKKAASLAKDLKRSEREQAENAIEAFMWVKLNLDQIVECYEIYDKNRNLPDSQLNLGVLGSATGVPIHFENYERNNAQACKKAFQALIEDVEAAIKWAQNENPPRLDDLVGTLQVGCCIESYSRPIRDYFALETGRRDPTLRELLVQERNRYEALSQKKPGIADEEAIKWVEIYKHCIGRRVKVTDDKESKPSPPNQARAASKYLTKKDILDELKWTVMDEDFKTLNLFLEQQQNVSVISQLEVFRKFLSAMEKSVSTNAALDPIVLFKIENIIPYLSQNEIELAMLVFIKSGLWEQAVNILKKYPGRILGDAYDSVLEMNAFQQAFLVALEGNEKRNQVAAQLFLKMIENGANIQSRNINIYIDGVTYYKSIMYWLFWYGKKDLHKKFVDQLRPIKSPDFIADLHGQFLCEASDLPEHLVVKYVKQLFQEGYHFRFKNPEQEAAKIFDVLLRADANLCFSFLEKIDNLQLYRYALLRSAEVKNKDLFKLFLDQLFMKINHGRENIIDQIKVLFEYAILNGCVTMLDWLTQQYKFNPADFQNAFADALLNNNDMKRGEGVVTVVKWMLSHGINPNIPNKFGRTLLINIIGLQHHDPSNLPLLAPILEVLVEHKVECKQTMENFGTSALVRAIELPDYSKTKKYIDWLITHNAPINATGHSKTGHWISPLEAAIKTGNLSLIDKLLTRGANLAFSNPDIEQLPIYKDFAVPLYAINQMLKAVIFKGLKDIEIFCNHMTFLIDPTVKLPVDGRFQKLFSQLSMFIQKHKDYKKYLIIPLKRKITELSQMDDNARIQYITKEQQNRNNAKQKTLTPAPKSSYSNKKIYAGIGATIGFFAMGGASGIVLGVAAGVASETILKEITSRCLRSGSR